MFRAQALLSPLNDSRVLLCCILALAAFQAVAAGSFEDVDANHDGSIDRTEFQRVAPAIDAFRGAFPIMDAAAKTMQADPAAQGAGMGLPNLQDEGFVSAFFNALVSFLQSIKLIMSITYLHFAR